MQFDVTRWVHQHVRTRIIYHHLFPQLTRWLELPSEVTMMALTWNVGNAAPPDDLQQLFGDVKAASPDLVTSGGVSQPSRN